jgi:integrase
MARRTVPLTDVQVRNAKAKAKHAKFFDGDGLFLLVSAAGSKGWRFKYRLNGKEKLMSFGSYPEVSLSQARDRRSGARKLVEQGVDPVQERMDTMRLKASVQENTFEKLAKEWLDHQGTLADSTKKMIRGRLKNDILPAIGKRPVSSIKPNEVLEQVIRPMEQRKAVVLSKRVKSIMSQVFCFAASKGLIEHDPTKVITGAMVKVEKGNRAAVTEPKELAPLLLSIDDYEGSHVVKCALRLLPLVFVRPGSLRSMLWQDIDFDAAEWRFTPLKTKKEMIVPLSTQSIEILQSLKSVTGRGELCFPSIRSALKPISDNTLTAAFRRMGYVKEYVCPHGFRATFRTIADEVLQQRYDLIEHQLGHVVRDPNGLAYNRTKHLPERHKMMQTWADYLDGLKKGAKVVPIKKSA